MITTIRLKQQESIALENVAFELTKKAIISDNKRFIKETDIVHFLISECLSMIDLDETGKLQLSIKNKNTQD